jgi:hypothetical protein
MRDKGILIGIAVGVVVMTATMAYINGNLSIFTLCMGVLGVIAGAIES